MSEALDFLIKNGMSLEEIQDKLADGVSMDELVSAVENIIGRGERLNTPEEQMKGRAAGSRVSIETVTQALGELGITLRYNQLLKEVEVQGLPGCYSSENAVNILPVYLIDYLNECGYRGVTPQAVNGCLSCIADRNRYNPILEYVQGGAWDGQDRFPEIYRILGITSVRHQTYIVKWFVQCVALGLNSEEKAVGAEGVLVLQGEQGLAKTSFFRMMTPFPRWFVEGAIIDMGNKDTMITSLSGWITELGELDSTLKKEQMALKAFVTRPEDRIRMPYAKKDARTPRRTSFCGTVNPSDYLRDETGSRRFWTIPVTSIDKKALFSLSREWVDQLWFQVHSMYQAAPDYFRLTDEEIGELQADNREFSVPLPYELEILSMLNYALPASQWEWWGAAEVGERLHGKVDARQVGKALAKIVKERGQSTHQPTRTVHGYTLYLIPLRHYQQNWMKKGG